MRSAYIKYLLALLLFGSNGIVASQIALNSYEIVFLRTLIGSALLTTLFLVTGNRFTFTRHKKDLAYLVFSGMAMGTSWMFLYEAYQQIGVGIASLLYYCGPVIVMVLSPLIFKEKLTLPKIIGFLAVLAGLCLVNGNPAGGEANMWGLFCGGMSAVMYFFMVTLNKKSKRVTGMENAAIQLTVSFLTVAVFVLFQQGPGIDLSHANWPAIAFLGLVNTGVGCYLYFSPLAELPVQSVAICGYLEPLSAVLLSVCILHESMLPVQIIGAALIMGGVAFGTCCTGRKCRSKANPGAGAKP